MLIGQLVTVKLYGGTTAVRRVLGVTEETVVVCSEEEYARAEKEGREPLCLGFPLEDVIDDVPEGGNTRKKGPERVYNQTREQGSQAGD